MRPKLLAPTVVATLALAGGGAAVVAAAPTAHTSAKRITRHGVDGVRLGRTFHSLRTDGLVGRLRPGCELAENTRSARLLAPLKGSVDFTQHNPRKVVDIAIRGGAKARGVGVGARARAIRRAFPHARFDHSTEDVFGITLVKIPRHHGGRMQFAVSTKTHRVTLIGVPFIAFCE